MSVIVDNSHSNLLLQTLHDRLELNLADDPLGGDSICKNVVDSPWRGT